MRPRTSTRVGSRVNEAGHLEIGGCDAVELARGVRDPRLRLRARRHPLPRSRVRSTAFAARGATARSSSRARPRRSPRSTSSSARRASASTSPRAASCTARSRAGFDPSRIYMHGNNKSAAELAARVRGGRRARRRRLARRDRAGRLAARSRPHQDVLIRLTPGIKPSTHSYVQTGQLDSKFGFGIADGQAAARSRRGRAPAATCASPASTLTSAPRSSSSSPTSARSRRWPSSPAPLEPEVARTSAAGSGSPTTADDEPPTIDEYVDVKVDGVQRLFERRCRGSCVEPGRSLVGNAGRHALHGRHGQGDPRGPHLRRRRRRHVRQPAADALRLPLRGADRRPRRRRRGRAGRRSPASTASPATSSSRDALLADPRPGDVLATPATGAYGYAMANNYNGVPRPPVVFCSAATPAWWSAARPTRT